MTPDKPVVPYSALARLFLKMSVLAFGGPVAHIAIGENEIVNRRRWLTHEEYMDMVAATNLIPGPNSTEVMIHVGHKTRGIPGALLAGFCFITPSFLIALALAILYVQYGALPQVASALWGIQPVIVAIIAVVAYRLAPAVIKSRDLVLLFVISLIMMAFSEIEQVILMLLAGLIFALWKKIGSGGLIAFITPFALQTAVTAQSVPITGVFWYFLRVGATLFGSGYVLISYIQNDLVNTFGWLTNQQLLDSVAIGQVTPGPVSNTAAVVGYIVGGIPAAIAATVAIFLPAFVLVILTAPLIPRMRRSPFWSAFLNGINAAVLAAILITTLRLAITAFHPLPADPLIVGGFSPLAIGLFGLYIFLMIRFKVNVTLLIAAGALIGILTGLILT